MKKRMRISKNNKGTQYVITVPIEMARELEMDKYFDVIIKNEGKKIIMELINKIED